MKNNSFSVFEVWSQPRDPYGDWNSRTPAPKRLKVFATRPAAEKFKYDWESDYCKNCDKSSDTYGKSPCWIDYESKLEIKEVEVEE